MLAVGVFIKRAHVQIVWSVGENWFVQPKKTDVSISAKKTVTTEPPLNVILGHGNP